MSRPSMDEALIGFYDGTSVKEKINLNSFSLPFFEEKNIFKIIFTPFIGERK